MVMVGKHADNKLLKRRRVRHSRVVRKVPCGTPPAGEEDRDTSAEVPSGEPELEPIQDDEGTVTHIHVRCPCGRELMVECDYSTED